MRFPTPLLLASMLFACGGQNEGASPAPAPAPTEAPPPASRPAPPPAPTSGTGSITLVTSADVLSASAYFGPSDTTHLPAGCTALSKAADTAQPSASAGDVTIDVPGEAGAIVLSYDPSARDYGSSYTGVPVPAGSTVHVHAAGSTEIPAFDADITTAAPPDVTAPADGASLPPSGDLPITWTPTNEPTFRVLLDVGTSQVACAFDGASGKGVIPASLLGPATATSDGSQPAVLTAVVVHAAHVTAGTFDVDLSHLGAAIRELKVAK